MPDDSTIPLSTDTSATDLSLLAQTVQDSYTQNGASASTVQLLREYVSTYLQQSHVELPPVSTDHSDLVADIENQLGLDHSDAALGPLILSQIEDVAAGNQAASTAPTQANVSKGADPIEMFSGEFQQTVTDLTLDGAGMNFAFRRIYKNQVVYFGPLGANWDHCYNLHLRESALHLVRSSGESREDLYTRHPQFGQAGFTYWVPPDGRHGIIEPHGSSFAWRSPNGVRYIYDRDTSDPTFHRIGRIEDRRGNYLAFTYDGDDYLRRIEINHPARFVTFDYDTTGRILSLQDHAGRRWTYDYDDYGDLVRVTSPATDRYPAGLSTYYEYSSAYYSPPMQHNLLRIIDPAGQLYLENDYGFDEGLLSFNRVVRQRQGNGEYLFDYQTVVDEFEFDYSDAEKPAFQTNQMLRNGQQVHFVYNRFGNLLLREEYLLEDGLARLVQFRYRYNRDGSLVGSITPEGSVTQYYYGRDDYLRTYQIEDDDVATDDNLTAALRMGFGNLLAVVRRYTRYSLSVMNLARGVWGDFFPDVLNAWNREDIVVKYTYEPDYQQLLTVSDPRFTARAAPTFAEGAAYGQHLTQYVYSTLPMKLLSQVVYPDTTYPSPLPNGTAGLTGASEQYLQYDVQGRLQLMQDAEGYLTQNEYFQGGPADPRTGYLQSTSLDVNTLQLTTTFDVNEVGVPVAVRNARGVQTTYVVNALNQVVQRTSGGPGFKTLYVFDENGLLVRQERDNVDDTGQPSADGNEIRTYQYDEQNNLLQQTIGGPDLSLHHVTRYRYDESDNRVATIFPLGNRIAYDYEERSLLRAVTRGATSDLASTTRTLYDADGHPIAFMDARGNETRYRYDTFGRAISTADALGNEQQRDYDKAGNLTVVRFFQPTLAGGYQLLSRSAFDYDERGTRIRATDFLFVDPIATADIRNDPDAGFRAAVVQGLVTPLTTESFFDRNKRLFRRVNARGQETTWEFDGVNRISQQQDDLGNVVRTFFDENSNVVRVDSHEQVLDPTTGAVVREDVFSTLYEYDLLDRRITITDGLGNQSVVAYDSRDNVLSVTDPLGNVRRQQFDIFNRKRLDLVEMTDTGLGGGVRLADVTSQSFFDDNDRLVRTVDGNGNSTRFDYDDLDRRYLTTYADASTATTSFDPDDYVVGRQDNNGLRVVRTIDPLGRLVRVDIDETLLQPQFPYPAGAERFEQYQYDGLGRVLQRTNDFCAVASRFDSLGRAYDEVLQFTTPYPPPPGVPRLQRTFDELSNRTDIIHPSGRAIHYDYDTLNRVTRIMNTSPGAAYPGSGSFPAQYVIAEYEYRGLRLDTATLGNQCTSELAYDGVGRVIETTHRSAGNVFLQVQQLFDAVGNRRFQWTSSAAGGPPHREVYELDSSYRLTRFARRPRPAFNAVQFLPSGVPLAANALNGQQAIDAAIGPLQQHPPRSMYTYDACGNRVREHLPAQAPVSYVPNNLDEYTIVGGTPYQYDLNGNLIDDGTWLYQYNYRNQLSRAVRKATNVEALRLLYDAGGRLVVVAESGQVSFLINDGLHPIEEYLGGTVVSQYVYENGIDRRCQAAAGGDEWWFHRDLLSSTRQLTSSNGQPLAADYDYEPFGQRSGGGAPLTPYLFSAQRLFPSINLYGWRARQYSPTIGRFLQRDPKGEGPNPFAYAGNNPVTYVDLLGLERQRATSSGASANQPGRSASFNIGTTFKVDEDLQAAILQPPSPSPTPPGPLGQVDQPGHSPLLTDDFKLDDRDVYVFSHDPQIKGVEPETATSKWFSGDKLSFGLDFQFGTSINNLFPGMAPSPSIDSFSVTALPRNWAVYQYSNPNLNNLNIAALKEWGSQITAGTSYPLFNVLTGDVINFSWGDDESSRPEDWEGEVALSGSVGVSPLDPSGPKIVTTVSIGSKYTLPSAAQIFDPVKFRAYLNVGIEVDTPILAPSTPGGVPSLGAPAPGGISVGAGLLLEWNAPSGKR